MQFLRRLQDMVVPTARNSYRPPLLHKHALVLFLAAALVAEGFYVANLFGNNLTGPLMAAAGVALPTGASMWVLGIVALVLAAALVGTVVAYAHIQPTDMLLPGAVILGIVVLLLVLNTWYGVVHG